MVARSAQQGSEIGGRGRRALRRAFAVSVLLHAAGVAALAFLHWEEAAPVVPPVTIPVVVLGPGGAGVAAEPADGAGTCRRIAFARGADGRSVRDDDCGAGAATLLAAAPDRQARAAAPGGCGGRGRGHPAAGGAGPPEQCADGFG